MTGADVERIFYSKYDEITGGILESSRINDMINQSAIEYYKPIIKAYGANGFLNDELKCLQEFVIIPSPNNYQVNFTSIPNYRCMGEVQTSYTLNGQTYEKTAQPLPYNSMKGSFSDGVVYAPKYQINNDILNLSPSIGNLNSVRVDYIRTVVPIDVDDSVTNLPYSEETINGIIDTLISIYAGSLGDMEQYQIAERSLAQNTNLPR